MTFWGSVLQTKGRKAKEQVKQEGFFLKHLHTQKANQEHVYDCTLVEASTGELNVVVLL